jgi:uncharacterized membrane protein YgdD (TMEM256/DUF423 family)
LDFNRGAGAFGAHSLKNILDEYGKSIYEKAVLYQMFHTLALFLVGVLCHLFKKKFFFLAGWGFFIGILLFPGSLYLLEIGRNTLSVKTGYFTKRSKN